VVVFDPKSNEPPTQYPLARTPLNLILAPQIDLTTAKMVVGTAEVGGLTHVVAQDPKHPEYGNIELIFTASPVSLTGWIVTDDSGNQTSVKLGPFKTEQDIPAMTFSVDHELLMRNR
jgi:outer membrane lipoprotein-sorting protein